MGYKTYPKYKESGIEWSQTLPHDWDEIAVKYGYEIQLGKMLQATPSTFDDIEVPYLKALHVNWSNIQTEELPLMWASPTEFKKYSVKNGDLLVCEGGEVGRACILKNLTGNAIIQNAIHRVRQGRLGELRYFQHLLQNIANVGWFSILCNKATIAHLTGEKLGAIKIPCPPYNQQLQIADFLDYKTSQIDRLIEKKRELIKKLQEQRIAIISQVVTRGLDPYAPTKRTGISWLGNIPSSWGVASLKRIIKEDTRNGLYKEKEQFSEDGVPFVQMGEAFAEPELIKTAKDRVNTTQGELQKWALLEGDLLFARRSLVFEGSGKCVIIGKLQEPHLFESSMIRVRIDTEKALPQFIFHYFQSAFSRAEILATTKTVTISGIDSQQLKGLTVCLPDIKTQSEIVEFIHRSSERFAAAINANSTTIARLQEYRTALITAAVTGQIDVRDWQAPETSEQSAQDKDVA